MCATCLLASVVQMWSSEAVVDGEEKVKQRHAVSMDRER
jgi:hypothetical protein